MSARSLQRLSVERPSSPTTQPLQGRGARGWSLSRTQTPLDFPLPPQHHNLQHNNLQPYYTTKHITTINTTYKLKPTTHTYTPNPPPPSPPPPPNPTKLQTHPNYGGGGRARPLGVEGGADVSRAGLKSAGRARRGITLEDEGETRVLDGTADGDGADVANSDKVPPGLARGSRGWRLGLGGCNWRLGLRSGRGLSWFVGLVGGGLGCRLGSPGSGLGCRLGLLCGSLGWRLGS